MNPTNFILDVDGVLTDGKFYYDQVGKRMKAFGADDHDALKILSKLLPIYMVTADQKGFEISSRRISEDMKFPLSLVSATNRVEELEKLFDLSNSIFMGDGILDTKVFGRVLYSIAPNNALSRVKMEAQYVTNSNGGERAVAEACFHIAKKFFDIDLLDV